MIDGTTSQRLTSPRLVLPFFILSSVSFLIIAILIFFSSDSFGLHYFHPKLLALTHIATLGFITSIIFGSLYQMFPVLFEVELKVEILGKLCFYCLLVGLILLSVSFWNFDVGILFQAGGTITLLSFLFFGFTFYYSIRQSKNWKIEYDFVSTSVLWLIMTGLVGLCLVFNFTYPFIPLSHLEVLKIHAHIGMVGWLLLLIIGVSTRLIPMFIVSKNQGEGKLKYTLFLLNGGLVAFSLAVYFTLSTYIILASILLMEAGLALFLFHILKIFKDRARKTLDTSLKLTFGAYLLLIIIIPLAVIVPFNLITEKDMILFRIVYGLLILLGFSGSLILGQALKVIPFILWMYRYQKLSGSKKIPLPKDLVSENVSKGVMYFFYIGLAALVVSIIAKVEVGIMISAAFLIVSAVLFNLNIMKALFYKIK